MWLVAIVLDTAVLEAQFILYCRIGSKSMFAGLSCDSGLKNKIFVDAKHEKLKLFYVVAVVISQVTNVLLNFCIWWTYLFILEIFRLREHIFFITRECTFVLCGNVIFHEINLENPMNFLVISWFVRGRFDTSVK